MKLIKGSTLTQENVSNKTIARTTAIETVRMHKSVTLRPKETSETFSTATMGFIKLIPEKYSNPAVRARCTELNVPSIKQLQLELENSKRNFEKQMTPLAGRPRGKN